MRGGPAPCAAPWLAALAALTALRLLVAAVVPPAPDEAYYWVWSRALQPGYPDHPPMVALFIRAGTALAGEGMLGIRLLFPLGIAVATLLLAAAAEALFPGRRAGLWAGLFFNATLLAGIGGLLATPDLPLVLFWCAALWALARLQAGGDGRWWLAVGLFAGLALASKLAALLLGASVLAWLLGSRGAWRWWRDARLHAGGAVALGLVVPVLAWEAGRGWPSLRRQGGRLGDGEGGIAWRHLAELLASQAGLATPLVFLLCVAGVWGAARAWARRGDAAAALLACLVLPGAALFLWQATGSRVQGNWPAILLPAASIAAARFCPARLLAWRGPAVGLGLVLAALVWIQAALAPLPLPRRADPTLARLGGWAELAAAVEAERQRVGAGFVAAEAYGLAAQLALHLPPGVPVVARGARWTFLDLPRPEAGVTGLLVVSERQSGMPGWPGAELVRRPGGPLLRARRGIEAERYRVFRVETGPALQDAALLPRPRHPAPRP